MNSESQTFIDTLGLEYSAQFVPQSLSRNAGEKQPSLNWRVTIARTRNLSERVNSRAVIATDYMQGIAHVPHYRHAFGSITMAEADYRRAQHAAAETGKAPGVPYSKWRAHSVWDMWSKPVPPPTLADVLNSLLLDASGTEESFEDWCSNYGCDTDSRKAETTYRACCDTARQLRQMFTSTERATLETLFTDY